MSIPRILDDLISIAVAPSRYELHRPHLTPGDLVVLDVGQVTGDVPLLLLSTEAALEREAFTGRPGNEVTGWIRTGDTLLVLSVVGDYAFLLGKPGNGWGWIDRHSLLSAHKISLAREGSGYNSSDDDLFSRSP